MQDDFSLDWQLRDKVAVLAFCRVCMTKNRVQFQVILIFGVKNVCASNGRQTCKASHNTQGTNNSLVFILLKVFF